MSEILINELFNKYSDEKIEKKIYFYQISN